MGPAQFGAQCVHIWKRQIELPLCLDHIAPDGPVSVLRLRVALRVFHFHQFIHKTSPLNQHKQPLLAKQATVRSCTGQRQHQQIVLNTVNQKPIQENVALPVTGPIPGGLPPHRSNALHWDRG